MKQLKPPKYDWRLVRRLCKKVNTTNAATLWQRNYGDYKAIKADITKKLLPEQSNRCAYCGSRLFEAAPHRDHIAPKDSYPQWTFWPKNIVLACYSCNTDRKKAYDPVVILGSSYKTTKFNFVHPYMDDPAEHLKFVGHRGGILICSAQSSTKGQATINLFDLTNPERTKQRAKDALYDNDVDHLHGKWRLLFEQVVLAPLPRRLLQKII